jgi:hypothetical protein
MDVNIERGPSILRKCAEGTDWCQNLDLQDTQRHGPGGRSRRDCARIMAHLDALICDDFGIDFDDLCRGELSRARETEKSGGEFAFGTAKSRVSVSRAMKQGNERKYCIVLPTDVPIKKMLSALAKKLSNNDELEEISAVHLGTRFPQGLGTLGGRQIVVPAGVHDGSALWIMPMKL